MNKKTRIIITVCGSFIVGGAVMASHQASRADAGNPDLNEKLTLAIQSYEAQQKIADAPGAATADEQKLKELASHAATLEAELNPKSAMEQFEEAFLSYKDMFGKENAYYTNRKKSPGPKLSHEWKLKGELIARLEKAQSEPSVNGETLLAMFKEETTKLNQKLYGK